MCYKKMRRLAGLSLFLLLLLFVFSFYRLHGSSHPVASTSIRQSLSFLTDEPKLQDLRGPKCKSKLYPSKFRGYVTIVVDVTNVTASFLYGTLKSLSDSIGDDTKFDVVVAMDASVSPETAKGVRKTLTSLEAATVVQSSSVGKGHAQSRGLDYVSGEVVAFVSSGTWLTVGWLEELLFTIASDPASVLIPNYDVLRIKDNAIAYEKQDSQPVVGFNQKMQYTFAPGGPTGSTLESPALLGNLFVMKTAFLRALGGLYTDFRSGEIAFLELSLRIWGCSGAILMDPCSRAAIQLPKTASLSEEKRVELSKLWLPEVLAKAEKAAASHPAAIKRAEAFSAALKTSQTLCDVTWDTYKEKFGAKVFTYVKPKGSPTAGKICGPSGLCFYGSKTLVYLDYCKDNGEDSFELVNNQVKHQKFGCLMALKNNEVRFQTCDSSKIDQWFEYDFKTSHIKSALFNWCLTHMTHPKERKQVVMSSECSEKGNIKRFQEWSFQNIDG